MICTFIQILFYFALFAFLFSYIFYPAILFVLFQLKFKHKEGIHSAYFPFVSVIIPVYNEASVIEEKILSVIDSNYPKDQLSIFVGSDASNDQSNAIIKNLESKHSNIHFYNFPTRRGKSYVVNDLLDYAFELCAAGKDHIVLFTDANVMLDRNAINELVKHFENSTISLVDSRIIPSGLKDEGISKSENTYINLEGKIKYWEGELFGCMMGAFGGCYAVRSNYVCKIPANFIVDDFYMSMQVLKLGGSNIVEPGALCYEVVPDKIEEEFRRKIRISSGNFQNLFHFRNFLITSPFSRAFCFISHKVLRWLGPFFILMQFATAILLISCNSNYKFIFLALGIIFVGIPVLDWCLQKLNINVRLTRNIRYFCMMNLALFIGFIRYVRGIKSGSWEPPKRSL